MTAALVVAVVWAMVSEIRVIFYRSERNDWREVAQEWSRWARERVETLE